MTKLQRSERRVVTEHVVRCCTGHGLDSARQTKTRSGGVFAIAVAWRIRFWTAVRGPRRRRGASDGVRGHPCRGAPARARDEPSLNGRVGRLELSPGALFDG